MAASLFASRHTREERGKKRKEHEAAKFQKLLFSSPFSLSLFLSFFDQRVREAQIPSASSRVEEAKTTGRSVAGNADSQRRSFPSRDRQHERQSETREIFAI